MSTNYHTPIPGPPAQPEATSELFNSRFSSLDSGISGKVDSTGNGSNITSEVSVAGTRRNLTNGGTLKVIFSEIQKWLSDMKAVAFSASYNDLINRPTTMTPTAHAATHKTGGSDALKAVDIGAVSEVLPGSNVTVSKNPDTGAVTINAAGGGSGGSAHIIANDGAALPNQGTLDFGVGLAAADDPATFKTAVSLDMGAIQIGKAQVSDFDSCTWSNLPLSEGWGQHLTWGVVKIAKWGNTVSVRGIAGRNGSTSRTMAVIPAVFRPLYHSCGVAVHGSGRMAAVLINQNGQISLIGSDPLEDYYYLNLVWII